MTETVTIDRPRSKKTATVSASALAQHLDCSRTYIGKLEAEGVLHRAPDGGFDLDASRIACLRYLRRERHQSPCSEADADFAKAKAKLVNLRIMERERALIPIVEAIEVMDKCIGIVLTNMSGMAARCAGHDLAMRRKIDQVVFETRVAISEAASALADQRGEPPEPEETAA